MNRQDLIRRLKPYGKSCFSGNVVDWPQLKPLLRDIYYYLLYDNASRSDLQKIQSEIIEFRDSRDWGQFHTPRNLAISISIESKELLEIFQWSDIFKVDRVEEELADILIYCLTMCSDLHIDPLDIISKKIKANGEKYPVKFCKGNSTKYTEINYEK